jgi:hypothetical protein
MLRVEAFFRRSTCLLRFSCDDVAAVGADGESLFKVHRETLSGGFSEPLLDDAKGERLEWLTKARHTQCVYGLLMRLEPGSVPASVSVPHAPLIATSNVPTIAAKAATPTGMTALCSSRCTHVRPDHHLVHVVHSFGGSATAARYQPRVLRASVSPEGLDPIRQSLIL